MTGTMQKMMIMSRCPQPSLSFNKKLQDDYNFHKKKIQQIMSRQRIKHSQSNPYLQMMRKSKQAKNRIGEQLFSTTKQQNQALLERLTNISRRKFSVSSVGRELHMHNEQEQKRIQYENQLLSKKLEDQKKSIMSKADIKKDIKDYLQIRHNLRRVRNSSEIQKKPNI